MSIKDIDIKPRTILLAIFLVNMAFVVKGCFFSKDKPAGKESTPQAVTVVTPELSAERTAASYTNKTFILKNFRAYDHRTLLPHRLLWETNAVEITAGGYLAIPENQFVRFEFAGDEYCLNYWCGGGSSTMKNGSTAWWNEFDDNLYIRYDHGDCKCTRADKDICYFWFKDRRLEEKKDELPGNVRRKPHEKKEVSK